MQEERIYTLVFLFWQTVIQPSPGSGEIVAFVLGEGGSREE